MTTPLIIHITSPITCLLLMFDLMYIHVHACPLLSPLLMYTVWHFPNCYLYIFLFIHTLYFLTLVLNYVLPCFFATNSLSSSHI